MEGEELDYNIEDALGDMTMEEEALLLGVERHNYFWKLLTWKTKEYKSRNIFFI